jgi:predicted nucleotidyltransferase
MYDREKIEELLISYFGARPEMAFAYAFGSFVRHDRYEDIDLAAYLSDVSVMDDRLSHPYGYESTIIGELSPLLHTDKIDFVVLNTAGLTLFTRVINKGKILVDRDRTNRIQIENSVRRQYIDAQPLRDIQMYYLLKRLKDAHARS